MGTMRPKGLCKACDRGICYAWTRERPWHREGYCSAACYKLVTAWRLDGPIAECATRHGTIIVDTSDLGDVRRHGWWPKRQGQTVYVRSRIDGRWIYLHQFLLNTWGAGGDYVVDHIDGNGLDNRRANIRYVSHSANMQNCARLHRRRNDFAGVAYCPDYRHYRAVLRHRGYGYYRTQLEAAVARDVAIVGTGNEYARPNFLTRNTDASIPASRADVPSELLDEARRCVLVSMLAKPRLAPVAQAFLSVQTTNDSEAQTMISHDPNLSERDRERLARREAFHSELGAAHAAATNAGMTVEAFGDLRYDVHVRPHVIVSLYASNGICDATSLPDAQREALVDVVGGSPVGSLLKLVEGLAIAKRSLPDEVSTPNHVMTPPAKAAG